MSATAPLPPVSSYWLRWFHRYIVWYLRRHFHALHLLRLTPPEQLNLEQLDGEPLLVCLNHPSWWDPLLALHLSQRFFPSRTHYGPIAASALAKYKFFSRLGFFGVEPGTARGAATFLRIAEAVLRTNNAALWITPQGEFTDVRKGTPQLQRGIGFLPRHVPRFTVLPVALEYTFWNESTPEAFACIGQPVSVDSTTDRSPDDWAQFFGQALADTQSHLARAVVARRPDAFEPLLTGRAGVGGVYDLWRSLNARLRGKRFEAEHGKI